MTSSAPPRHRGPHPPGAAALRRRAAGHLADPRGQHDPPGHLRQTLPHQHHEAGGRHQVVHHAALPGRQHPPGHRCRRRGLGALLDCRGRPQRDAARADERGRRRAHRRHRRSDGLRRRDAVAALHLRGGQ